MYLTSCIISITNKFITEIPNDKQVSTTIENKQQRLSLLNTVRINNRISNLCMNLVKAYFWTVLIPEDKRCPQHVWAVNS